MKQKTIKKPVTLSGIGLHTGKTVRMTITNTRVLAQKEDQLTRFFAAYAESLGRMYTDPAAMKVYIEWAKVPDFDAGLRDQFYPRVALDLNRLSGIKEVMDDAVSMKFIPRPLTDVQLKELFGSYQK